MEYAKNANDELCEKRYVLDARVARVEKEMAVIDNRIGDLKAFADRIEREFSEHNNVDFEQFHELKNQLNVLDKDVLVQKGEINFIKITMVDIQKSIASIKDHLDTSVEGLKTQVQGIQKTITKWTAWGGAALFIVTLFKDPILHLLGLK